MKKNILFFLCCLFTVTAYAQATKDISIGGNDRLAVVIGNNKYQHVSELTTPVNDAKAMQTALEELGFDVLPYFNTKKKELNNIIGTIVKKVKDKKYGTVLIYYSGHGLQFDENNYLIPVDANPHTQGDVADVCIRAGRFLDNLAALGVPTKIMLLDACRNNPFKSLSKSLNNNGLGQMNTPSGTFYGFAASPGAAALDGQQLGLELSPYTQAIIENISSTGLSIDAVFTRVNKRTKELCRKAKFVQTPFKSSSLSDDFYFKNLPKVSEEFTKNATSDTDEVSLWYEKAVKYYNEKNYTEAFEFFEMAALDGDAKSQTFLGYFFENGLSVSKNYVDAVKWYRKAAEQGYNIAQYNLGNMYKKGYGVLKNPAIAAKYYRKAAESGYIQAQENLGLMYENGNGVSKNYALAQNWYRKAAGQGSAYGQNALGNLSYHGNGVSKNYETAVEWFRKAAEQKFAVAQYNLGLMYEYGRGISVNQKEAIRLYKLAAKQDYPDAQKALTRLGETW